MKKILFVMSVAILLALCSAPSLVLAANPDPEWGSDIPAVGTVYMRHRNYNNPVTFTVRCSIAEPFWVYIQSSVLWTSPTLNSATGGEHLLVYYSQYSSDYIGYDQVIAMYIPTLEHNYTINGVTKIFNNIPDYNNYVPETERLPEPTISEQRWDAFYEWYKNKFGYYPVEGSLIDMLRKLAIGDSDPESTEIMFVDLPTPTPTPTPIPVQTIFVPDGNGNTTIVYQYTDPTTGVITQSPYNPNINIDVNCNCDSGNGNDIFSRNPSDPYTLTSSMLWSDGFGVQITDNPLTAANDSQKSLAEAAAEYSDSVNVVSNSFNVLPFKWLVLVGLLGGILIIAGLLRTFLGG